MNESMSGILKDNFTVYRSGQLFATISMIDNDLVVDTPYGKIPGERLPPQDPSDRFLCRWWFSNEIKGRAVYHMSTIRKTVKNQLFALNTYGAKGKRSK